MNESCGSGNIDLVKYLISLNKLDIKAKKISKIFHKISNKNFFVMFASIIVYEILTNNLFFYETLLHSAARSGNLDLVKYLISLKEIDVAAKNI